MRRGHGQVNRRIFEPIAQIGDIVALRGGDGFITEDADTPFYVVTNVEASPLLGVKGTVVMWCATNAPAAPYNADKASLVGVNLGVPIPAGGTLSYQPDMFTLQTRQVMQLRTLVRNVGDSNAAHLVGVIDDYDVRFAVPSATSRFGTARLIGVLNAQSQSAFPSDVAAAPAQGTNLLGTVNNQSDPFDLAARTELFLYGTNLGNGQISITNNGAAAATTGAIGLQMANFLLNLFPIAADGVVPRHFLGYNVPVPAAVNLDDVIVIPTAAQSSPKAKGS